MSAGVFEGGKRLKTGRTRNGGQVTISNLQVSIFYVFGHVLLSFGAIPGLSASVGPTLDFLGLGLIALSTGGIKPCVSAFAADQFQEGQEQQRTRFFSYFYVAINLGSLAGMLIVPVLRKRVSCLDSNQCYPLAFGVPGLLMLMALLIFVGGWRLYTIHPASGQILCSVFNCIRLGAKGKCKQLLGRTAKRRHWLDHAMDRYDPQLVTEIKVGGFLNFGWCRSIDLVVKCSFWHLSILNMCS